MQIRGKLTVCFVFSCCFSNILGRLTSVSLYCSFECLYNAIGKVIWYDIKLKYCEFEAILI